MAIYGECSLSVYVMWLKFTTLMVRIWSAEAKFGHILLLGDEVLLSSACILSRRERILIIKISGPLSCFDEGQYETVFIFA